MARVFITGSTDGLGLAAALALLDQNHQVVLHARSTHRVSAMADIAARCAGVVVGDLSSAKQTRAVADQVNALGRMDAVIHNAGVYREPDRGMTPEGHPTLFAVNTLAPYLLTALVMRPRRLVYLSSGLHRGGEGSLVDLAWTKRPWNTGQAYAESKLQVAALAFAIARRWPTVLSNVVDPGWARTRMGGSSAPVDVDTGQRTQSWLATSDDVAARVTGRYWKAMRQEEPAREATDHAFQDTLVARLAEITGVALG
jgi:NAD(P)-dependent dehydrogenase (short-subunit alcohol dehydrogenase family)